MKVRDQQSSKLREAGAAARLSAMRLTQAESERNRNQILEAAGRLFRERGFDGVGLDGLMKGAGFTHGGFYNHFASKEELEVEASAAGAVQANAALVDSLSDPRGDGWKRFVRGYLSADHRGDPASGCTLGRRERLPGLPRLRNPHPGLRRVRCGECGNELLVAFSCKRRGICPSCNALNALCACR
jgi:AcrR family transcriptional regulator